MYNVVMSTDLIDIVVVAAEETGGLCRWLNSLMVFLMMAVVIQLGSQWLVVSFRLPQSPH